MTYEPKTFLELVMAMKLNALVTLNDYKGYIRSVQKEDGSGTKWNVNMQLEGSFQHHTVFFAE